MFLRASLCLGTCALFGACLMAHGQNSCQRCTTSTMDGEWAFSCSGVAPNPYTITPANSQPLIQPFAMNGVFTVHRGHIEGPSTTSFNGQLTETFATTSGGDPLVLKSDCTGSVTYQVSMPGFGTSTMSFQQVLFNNGNEGFGMPTNPGMVVTCHIVRIHR